MKKHAIKKLFGETQLAMAAAVGVTKQAVSSWPDDLPMPVDDRIIGAAIRTGALELSRPSRVLLEQIEPECDYV